MSKKDYSIHWQDDKAVGFEIDGVSYKTIDEIPAVKDRRKLMAMIQAVQDSKVKQEPEKPPFPFENVILAIFTGVAVVMLLITGISSASAIGTLQKEKSAPGVVVDVVVHRQYDNVKDRIFTDYYYPVVDFTADDGRRRKLEMNTGSDSPEYEKGNEVTVLYDPQHPLDARIKSFGSAAMMWVLPSITGILGISFLVAVIAVRVVMSREQSSTAPEDNP